MKNTFRFLIIAFAFINISKAQNLVLADTTNMYIDTTWIDYPTGDTSILNPILLDFDKNGSTDVQIMNYGMYVGTHDCYASGISADCYNDFYLSCNNGGTLYPMFGYESSDSLCTIPVNGSVWTNDIYVGIMVGGWCGPGSGGSYPTGFWLNRTTPGYLGVQKMVGGTSVLGWVKITLNDVNQTLVEYAFPRNQLIPQGVEEKSSETNFTVFPNPGNGEMNLKYRLKGNDEGQFSIYDIHGKCIRSYVLNANTTSMVINEGGLSNGIYFYKAYINQQLIKTEKIVIIK